MESFPILRIFFFFFFSDSTENSGPDWHHSWLWSIAFYCGEHFAEFPFRSRLVIDLIAQSALNGLLLDNPSRQSFEMQHQILQVTILLNLFYKLLSKIKN